MTGPPGRERELHAYRDGELSWLRRWWVGRRLAREPEAGRALQELTELGVLIRESQEEPSAPDLWPEIASRLPAHDTRNQQPTGWLPRRLAGLTWSPRPLGAGIAALAAAALVGILLFPQSPEVNEVVRWLDPGGKPVMLLQGDDGTTIIWVFDLPTGEEAEGRSGGVG